MRFPYSIIKLVIVKYLKTLLSLFRNKDDRFLVLEMLESGNRGVSIRADFADKTISVSKIVSNPSLKKIIKKFGRLAKYKIILGLDSHLATTIYSSVVLVRDRYKELIDEPELDNLISQAIWKFFDRQRNKVAAKMNVTDLDIVLTDVRIRGVKLDGHKVVNPIGFKAKTVEIQFSQTFLLRDFVNSVKEYLPLNLISLVSENGTAWASVIAKANLTDNFLLANLYGGKTLMFFADGIQNSYCERFNWGEENVHRSLAADLAITPAVAKLIVGKCAAEQTSLTFRKRLESLFIKELEVLAGGINTALKKADTKLVYLNTFFDLPAIFSSAFKSQFERSVVLQPTSIDLISQNFGFDIKFKNSADSKNSSGLLVSLMEWYLAPQDDRMSQLAKRRVRWLSPL